MAAPRASAEGQPAPLPARATRLPAPRTSWVVVVLCLVTVVVSGGLAGRPGAHQAQTALVVRLNHPPQPLGALFALVNPLFRPIPLTVLVVMLAGWVLLSGGPARRWECLRALAVSLIVAELLAQTLKRVVDQPRPTAVIPGLDVHGYPQDPWGRAYPSAHTAMTVASVAALWPWMSRTQRAAGLAIAVLVPLNRIYIGAHWPLDVVGGVAVGLLAAALTWLVAVRWPIRSGPAPV
jgi:membrane-associated phospholipid phosphatase